MTEASQLAALVSERIRLAAPGRVIGLVVQSAGEGSGWIWFHAEELIAGQRIGQPLNLPVKIVGPARDRPQVLADRVATAIMAHFGARLTGT